MARQCVFCGAPANSKEDALPGWLTALTDEIPGAAGPVRHELGRGVEYAGGAFDIKVRQVCKSCNNEWMSDLETQTKPLLEPLLLGKRTWPIPDREQIRLATWAYKTGIMLALSAPPTVRSVPLDDYRYFYEHRKPPDGTAIWMAGLVPLQENQRLRVGWSKPERLEFRTRGEVFAYGYRLSISVIALVFQVVRSPIGGKMRRPRAAESVWTRVRPISKGSWPPQQWLSPEALDQLGAGRITHRQVL